jgi:hypothetical protein
VSSTALLRAIWASYLSCPVFYEDNSRGGDPEVSLGCTAEVHALGQPEALLDVIQAPLLMVWGVPLVALAHELEVDGEIH